MEIVQEEEAALEVYFARPCPDQPARGRTQESGRLGHGRKFLEKEISN